MAVEVRNATLCHNINFVYWACKVCVSIQLCTSSVFTLDLLPYVCTCTLIQGLYFGACLKSTALSWATKFQFEDVGGRSDRVLVVFSSNCDLVSDRSSMSHARRLPVLLVPS